MVMKLDMDRLREEVDRLDRQMIKLLCRRFRMVQDIAGIKQRAGLRINDRTREREIIENCKSASKGRLDERFIEQLMRLILTQSKNIQRRRK